MAGGRIALVKTLDGERTVLASAPFTWELGQFGVENEDVDYEVTLQVKGDALSGHIGSVELKAVDGQSASGGLGLVVTNGSIAANLIKVVPVA